MSTNLSDSTSHSNAKRVDFRRGTLWMLLSLVCFSGNALIVKACSTTRHIDPWLTVCIRFGVGLLMTVIIFSGPGALNMKRSFTNWLLASRGVLGALATAALYFSIGPLGAGKAMLISNTWCVWAAILAAMVLHERLGLTKLLGIVIAIGGLALLTDISAESLAHDGKWEAISLIGAVLAAMVVVVIRQLTKTETSATIFASQCLYGLLLTLPFAVRHMVHLTAMDYILMTVAALFAGVGQIAMTEGFRFLTVATGGAFQITLPLIICLCGILFLGEQFTLMQALGGLLILIGSFQTVIGIRWRRRS